MTAQTLLRFALLMLALFNMGWTASGVLAIFRQARAPLAMFQAAVFWLCAGTVAFQAFALFSIPNEATRIGSGLTLLVGLGAAASLAPRARHLAKFGRLLVNVDAALAIVDLSLVDRSAAEIKASECRRLTAKLMSNG